MTPDLTAYERLLRLPVIRHIRYFAFVWAVNHHYEQMQDYGFMFTGWSREEIDHSDALWRGEA